MINLEPIARAMAESLPPAKTISNAEWAKAKTMPDYPEFEGMARAVYLATLKAIRVLDEGAACAGNDVVNVRLDKYGGLSLGDTRAVFTAMIDHMIGEAE